MSKTKLCAGLIFVLPMFVVAPRMAGMGPTIETWAAAVNANWTTAADWSGGIVPSTSAYSAVMNAGSGGYTITFNSSEQVSTFTEDNGTLAISSGAILYLDQSAGSSTISGTVQFTQGQILALGGSTGHTLTVTSTGAINATSSTSYIAGDNNSNPLTLVINPGATVTSSGAGTDLVLGYYTNDVVNNAGTITANDATIGMGGPNGSWTNTGTLQAINNGVISLSGFFTTASLGGTISATTGGVLELTGTLTQTGTLAAPANGSYTLYGGTIIGGTIDGSNGALTFSNNGGLLNGVTVINNLSVPASANFTVSNGTTFGGDTSWGGSDALRLLQSLTIGPSQTWNTAGYVNVLAQTSGVAVTNQGTMNMEGGTISGNGYSGYSFTNSGTVSNMNSGLNFTNYNGDSFSNSGSVVSTAASFYASLYIGGGSGTTTTNTASGTIEALQTGSIGYSSDNGIGDGTGSTVTNSGTIEAVVTGSGYAQVYVGNGSGTQVTNTGTLLANGTNATLYLGYDGTYSNSEGSTWSNIGGTITASNGGTVYLGGAFTSANLAQGTINGMGGTLDLVGTLTNTGTLAPPTSGVYTLYGGIINGGTIDGANGALTFSSNGGTLNGVSVINNLTLPSSAYVLIEGGTTFGGNISFGGSNTFNLGQSLTIGPSQSWTAAGYITSYAQTSNVTLTNQGTLSLQGGTFASGGYTGYLFNNAGTLTNTNAGMTISNYTQDQFTNSGTLQDVSNGNYASVNIGNGSSSVLVNTATGLVETSQAGSIGYSSDAYLGDGTGALVTNGGTIEAVVTGSGYAQMNVGNGYGTQVTNTGNLLASGAGASLYLSYDGTYNNSENSTWTNAGGTITASNGGTVFLGGAFTTANLTQGTIYGAGGTLNLVGTLTNSGTLAPPSSGIYTLYGGIISGGTIDGANGALAFSSTGGTLNGVSVVNDLSLPYGSVVGIEGGTTFGGNINFGGNNTFYLDQSVTVGPSQTWTAAGPVTSYAQTSGVTLTNQGTLSLQGGIFASGGYSGYLFDNAGTLTNTNAYLTISDYNQDQFTNSGSFQNISNGNYASAHIGDGNGSVVVNTASGLVEASQVGSVGYYSDAYFGDGSNAQVTNSGTIEAVVTGSGFAQMNVGNGYGTQVTNTGTLLASGTNAALYLGYDGTYNNSENSTWTNAGGTITASNGGTVYLGGSFTNANLTQGTIYGAGGTLNLVGTLTNSGTLAPPTNGIYTLYGGIINGGTIDGSNGALTFSNSEGTLNGVSVINDLSIPFGSVVLIEGGTTFGGNISFGGSNTFYLGQSVAIGPSQSWTASGAVTSYAQAANVTITNQGTMSLQGGTFSSGGYAGYLFDNAGTLTNANAYLSISDYYQDQFTNSGTFLDTSNGYYSSANIGAGGGSVVVNTASGLIEASQAGSLNYSSDVDVGSGSGATVTNSGTIEAVVTGSGSAQANVGNGYGTQVTNTGTLLANGPYASLYLSYDGTYNNSEGSTWTNVGGTITALNGGTVYLGGTFTNANLTQGTINGAGGSLDLVGTLTNSGTLAPPTSGIYTLYGGTIVGGAINNASSTLAFSNSGGLLQNVSLSGNFSVPSGGYFTVSGSTEFTGGTIALSGGNSISVEGTAAFTIPAGETVTDAGSLSLFGYASNLTIANQGVLSMSGGTIDGRYYGGFVFTNSGTIINTGYPDLYIGDSTTDQFMNTGTVEQNGPGYVYIGDNGAGEPNLSGTELLQGTWIASGGGYIYFGGSSPVTEIGPGTTVVLSGSGADMLTFSGVGPSYQTLEQTLTLNNGTLELLANKNYASTSAGITNNGTIQLGGGTFTAAFLANNPGSELSGSGTFNPTGGVTIGNNVLVSPGTATAGGYVGTLTFNSIVLGSGGSYTFALEDGTLTKGVGYDTITATGAASITATPGSPFTINVLSINPGTGLPGTANMNMSLPYQWTLLSAASITGFSASDFTLNTAGFTNPGGGGFSITANATSLFLDFTPVPEPSTWALLGLGAAGIAAAGIARRRRASLASCKE